MERFTERDEFGNADIIGVDSGKLQGNLGFDELNRVTRALNRLAKLEDKLGSGQLVELPIPLQKNYFRLYQKGTKYEKKVWVIRKVGLPTLAFALLNGAKNWDDIFLNEKQAKVRLKELKEGL